MYEPLERHFGTLKAGNSFGESILLGGPDKTRFFNAIALEDCVCLQLSKFDFDYVCSSSERKIFNEKLAFIRSIPEFKTFAPPSRSKLVYFCSNLIP